MDKKSKVLLWIFALLIAVSVGVTYWRIMIKKDYIIEAQADCDPALETCFVYECDPEAEECTGNPEEDIWYYKIVRRNAANIPLCDPADENCEALTCPEGEAECEMVLCTDETKEEDQICNDPEQYVLDNPVEEEEAVECEEGDEECVEAEIEEAVCAEGDEECLVTEGDSGEVVCEEGDEKCAAAQENEESIEDNSELENVDVS